MAVKEPLAKEMYSVLACPNDKSDVKYTKDKKSLQCVKCKKIFLIENGIPIMLP